VKLRISTAPQSNQRGIETRVAEQVASSPIPGLNRTSVGLKHGLAHGLGRGNSRPQSNQRGIETAAWELEDWGEAAASIEPAWD